MMAGYHGSDGVASGARLPKLSKPFVKDFQIYACFLQAFPKIPLAVLNYFKGLQALQARLAFLQIFASGRLPQAPPGPYGETGGDARTMS